MRRRGNHSGRVVKRGHDTGSLYALMRYESLKSAWIASNLKASPQEFEAAIKKIAGQCGV